MVIKNRRQDMKLFVLVCTSAIYPGPIVKAYAETRIIDLQDISYRISPLSFGHY